MAYYSDCHVQDYQRDKMKFSFAPGDGWDHLNAGMATKMISHLPPSVEEFWRFIVHRMVLPSYMR